MNAYEALRTSAAYLDLSTRGKLRLTGEDRARLLHAMSSNDVNHLGLDRVLYAFFLTAQGRILADAYILNLGESLWLDTEPELGPKLFAHLDKYIIADDVTIDDETNAYAVIGLEGPEFEAAARQLQLPVPGSKDEIRPWGEGFIIRAATTAGDGLRIFLPIGRKLEFVTQLQDAGFTQASADEADVVRIENGIPSYGTDIGERYLVQETGLLHAIHTNKGCYLGQEIVERVRSQGQVHRHLSRVRITGKNVPLPGTKLTTIDGKNGGEITSSAYSPAFDEIVALAYLRTEIVAAKPEMQIEDAIARVA